MGAHQFDQPEDQAAEVERALRGQQPLVDRVDPRHLLGPRGTVLCGRILRGGARRGGQASVAVRVHQLVLGPPNRSHEVAQIPPRVGQVLVVLQAQRGQVSLQQRGGVRRRQQSGHGLTVGRSHLAQHPQAEGVERGDRHRAGGLGRRQGNALAHLARGAIGEGQGQNALGRDPALQQEQHALDQCARLAGARPGVHQHRPVVHGGRRGLARVEDHPAGARRGFSLCPVRHLGAQQGTFQGAGHRRLRDAVAGGQAGQAFARQEARSQLILRDQERGGKGVGFQLGLSARVVDFDPAPTHRRGLHREGFVDSGSVAGRPLAVQVIMAQLMSQAECRSGIGQRAVVGDVGAAEHRPRAAEQRVAAGQGHQVQPRPFQRRPRAGQPGGRIRHVRARRCCPLPDWLPAIRHACSLLC